MSFNEYLLRENLKNLKIKVKEEATFESNIRYIKTLFVDYYPTTSPEIQKMFYDLVCDIASLVETKFTEASLLLAGKSLFEFAEKQFTDSEEKNYIATCTVRVRERLGELANEPSVVDDFMPALTTLQVARRLLTSLGVVAPGTSHTLMEEGNNVMRNSALMDEMTSSMEEIDGFRELLNSVEAAMQGIGDTGPLRRPPASKEVIEKLPVISLSEEIMEMMGSDMECAVCSESLILNEKLNELPCTHLFHPLCLKPWLEKQNTCPVCRHELPTDDVGYESWKAKEREAKLNELIAQIE